MNEAQAERAARVDQLEQDIAAQESARAASTKVVEQLIADCHAVFIEHASGVRILQFLEDYFMPEANSSALVKLSAEEVKSRIDDAEGARKVVRFLKAASAGQLNATEGKHSEPPATQAT